MGSAITCQRCLFLGRVTLQQSMKNIWENINSKSFQRKTKRMQCTHERLQYFSQNPVRFPSPFRPSVPKAKGLQTSMPVFFKYPEGTNHRLLHIPKRGEILQILALVQHYVLQYGTEECQRKLFKGMPKDSHYFQQQI